MKKVEQEVEPKTKRKRKEKSSENENRRLSSEIEEQREARLQHEGLLQIDVNLSKTYTGAAIHPPV